jgi:hypothetical protein
VGKIPTRSLVRWVRKPTDREGMLMTSKCMGKGSHRWGWFLAGALLATPLEAAPLRVTLEPDAVVATGVTAGGQVVLLGVTREIEPDDFPTARRHLEVLTDTDGDGAVRYSLATGIPLRSLWSVVDMTSGESGLASPEALGTRQVDWRGRGLQRRTDGKDSVEDQRTLLELVVVRPQVGAGAGVWALRISDGDESDADGRIDGRLEGFFDRMQPLAASTPPPSAFQRGDVVLALDPTQTEITLEKVP